MLEYFKRMKLRSRMAICMRIAIAVLFVVAGLIKLNYL